MEYSKILDKVHADLQRQEMKGLSKYGGTLDAEFSELQVLQHAYEEALDLCMYLAKTIQIKRKQALIELTQDEPYERADKSGNSEEGSGTQNTIPTT